MKERLKVGDKNKLGERRKLIIHNRQFTWMSTTDTEKLRLLPSKKKYTHFLAEKISILPPLRSLYLFYLFSSEVKDTTRNLFFKRSRHQTIQTELSFQILHAGAHIVHPL